MGWLKDAVELIATAVRKFDGWEAQMATWDEQIQGISDKVTKIGTEIRGKLDELQTALENPTPEQQAALDALSAQLDELDAVVPDAPEEPPVG